jgi:hypothetical protein
VTPVTEPLRSCLIREKTAAGSPHIRPSSGECRIVHALHEPNMGLGHRLAHPEGPRFAPEMQCPFRRKSLS